MSLLSSWIQNSKLESTYSLSLAGMSVNMTMGVEHNQQAQHNQMKLEYDKTCTLICVEFAQKHSKIIR